MSAGYLSSLLNGSQITATPAQLERGFQAIEGILVTLESGDAAGAAKIVADARALLAESA